MKKKLLAFLLVLLITGATLPINVFAALPAGVPAKLATPSVSNVYLTKVNSGKPIFRFEVKVPQSILDLDAKRPADGIAGIDYYCRVDDGKWEKADGGYLDNLVCEPENKVPGKPNTFYAYAFPLINNELSEIDVRNHTYWYKVQICYEYHFGEDNNETDYIYTDFSNEAYAGKPAAGTSSQGASTAGTATGTTAGAPSVEAASGNGQKYSGWAKAELDKAADFGLIPGILKDADMTKPITREEFCELAVRLYENTAGKPCEPVSENQFTDTVNPEILKAYKLGIAKGTSSSTFSPMVLINREQCAVMLFNTIKALRPDGNFSTAGIRDFPDQKHISGWASDAAKYMSKAGIITGDSKGNFMPKAVTSSQRASNYGMAAREQAVALALRSYELLNNIRSAIEPDKSPTESKTPVKAHPSQARLKLPAAFPKEIPFTSDATLGEIVDNSRDKGAQSITLTYTTKLSLSSILKLYRDFLSGGTDVKDEKLNGLDILEGHINYFSFSVFMLNSQVYVTVTPDGDKFPS